MVIVIRKYPGVKKEFVVTIVILGIMQIAKTFRPLHMKLSWTQIVYGYAHSDSVEYLITVVLSLVIPILFMTSKFTTEGTTPTQSAAKLIALVL